jgi:hypothetical protein
MEYCRDKSNRIEALIVWKLDRFARNIEDHYMIKATLRRMGVKVVSVTEPVDTDPNGKLMEAILAGFAQFDNDIRSIRSVQGMKHRLQEGIFPWDPPIGYLPPRMGKKKEPDRPDPACFDLLQRAWHLLASGAYTKAAIVRLLRSWGVRGKSGRLVTPQLVDRIFVNPFYAGVLRDPWSGAEIRGRHTPMVSTEDFARVQEVIGRRSRHIPHHRVSEDFPVRGLVRCSACQWPLTAGWSKGLTRRYAYYYCFRRDCPRKKRSLPAAEVHREFLEFLPELAANPHVFQAATEVLLGLAADEMEGLRVAGARRKDRVAKLQRQLQELVALRTQSLLSDEEFQRARDDLRDRLSKAQAAVARISERPLTRTEASGLISGLVDLPRLWQRLEPLEREAFGQCLFPSGYLFQTIRTAERGLLFKVFDGSSSDNPHVVAHVKANSNSIVAEIRRFLGIVGRAQQAQEQAA